MWRSRVVLDLTIIITNVLTLYCSTIDNIKRKIDEMRDLYTNTYLRRTVGLSARRRLDIRL